jgi:hypothetical protein
MDILRHDGGDSVERRGVMVAVRMGAMRGSRLDLGAQERRVGRLLFRLGGAAGGGAGLAAAQWGLLGYEGGGLGERGVVEGADVFGFVGVAFLRGEEREGFVFLGADVGTGQLGAALALVGHGREERETGFVCECVG